MKRLPRDYLEWMVNNLASKPDIVEEAKMILGLANQGGLAARPAKKRKAETIKSLREEIKTMRLHHEEELERQQKKIENAEQMTIVFDEWYRTIALIAHPDRGGDVKVMQLINDLRDKMKKLA